MLIGKPTDITPSEITPQDVYARRRAFIKSAALLGAASGLGMTRLLSAADGPRGRARLAPLVKSPFSSDEKLTGYEAVTSYINFYEFGTGKADPKENAHTLRTRPWSVQVDGEVHKPRSFDIEELLKLAPLEERIYRLRCVEAWSMVIPWIGFPFSEIVKRVEPTGNAKYVEFVTLHDPEQMPGQRVPVLDWPYVEGLRLDEALHPLTLLTLGLYGEVLPNQNGAPVRIVVPWKYGFKSGKSIVRIRFVERQPKTSWMLAGPREYGFYSNVNPDVDHPRWSQARERRIGEFRKRDTLLFNGYAEQVAGLYSGMDLKKNF